MTASAALPLTPHSISFNGLAVVRQRLPTAVLFAASSLSSWVVDYMLVLALSTMTGSVLGAVVSARLVSSTMNFLVNRSLFASCEEDPASLGRAVTGYATVQACLMSASYLALGALTVMGAPLWLAKILADSTLFVVNYLAQSRLVYR
ncbi:GtrA family protein [Actinomyces bowdenii]|uniref:GtrA family protein n=1 Tax=Actinomyces bowdenii TaxID=131109 RepID=UPI001ABCBED0|nr:GtrA family protein [Actinomyces bowdenii]MBO3724455.1 GtrA family protein [Actinomyces bowdenii]